MSNKTRVGLVATVLAGLLVLSGAVMAAELLLEADTETEATAEAEVESEDDSDAPSEADTQFSFGYDEANRYLVVSVEPTEDEESECQLETDAEADGQELTYEIGEDGISASDGTGCELHAVDVTGPEGQVNHGMFMKSINELIDTLDLDYGRGCIIRHLARSDLGKGEQQVRPGDADAEIEDGTVGTVDFTTVLTACEHGGDEVDDETEGRPEWAGQGRPEWAGKGRPDSPGKSASAPGRDR